MASQKHEFQVEMTCEGCSGAVTRVLNKLKPDKGVTDFQIDMDAQKVYVDSTLSSDELLQTIQKTGKTTSYVGVKN
ncbi:copper transport protein ATOX1-like [Saccoglossus kowalevskii]|uniref:Copper transport protein ATOX1 n=1 Tax=Saccoglossus kowalevskii TaxID=10224 RepID=A0ABM0MFZ0_SACKO|nr:PREDICTED: copper transport protein ATOX1-like [Saccoglossus kowalevskii]